MFLVIFAVMSLFPFRKCGIYVFRVCAFQDTIRFLVIFAKKDDMSFFCISVCFPSSGPSACSALSVSTLLLLRLRPVYVIRVRVQSPHHEVQHICRHARSGCVAAVGAGFHSVKCSHPAE